MSKRKEEHYSTLKTILRIVTLAIAIWALIVAYQAKTSSEWVSEKQDQVIEKLMFGK